MSKEQPTLIHEAFLTAGWSEPGAKWGVLRVYSLAAAQQIVAAATNVPESVRLVIMRDTRHNTSDVALVAAFKEANEIALILNSCARSAPLAVRNLGNYVVRHESGERMMTAAEARTKLTNALAEMDVHIDTSRRVSPLERGPAGSMAQVADAHWAAQKAAK